MAERAPFGPDGTGPEGDGWANLDGTVIVEYTLSNTFG